MAGLASQLLEFPPQNVSSLSDEQYNTRLRSFVDGLTKVDHYKLAKADAESDLLQILSPAVNSNSYLLVLTVRIARLNQKSTATEVRSILIQALSFLGQFDGVQVRYAGVSMRNLMEKVVKIASDLSMLPQVINPLLTAIFRLDPSAGTLSSTHLTFLHICLSLRNYREALPLIDATIHSFPAAKATTVDGAFLCSPHSDSSNYINENTGLSEKLTTGDVHEYYLCGAMIYIGLQQWEDARLYLECVLVSPTQGNPTGLQVEAYKKWALLGCIIKGAPLDAPRGLSQNALRTMKSVSKPYETLVDIFQRGNLPRLNAEVAAGHKHWHEDANLGLVQHLVASVPRFYVLGLQKIYSAIPLLTVAGWLKFQIDETHVFIEQMVGEGVLNADIDLSGDAPVLRFFSNQSKGPLAKTEKQYHAELLAQTKRTNVMADYVKMSDRRLTLTKEYIDSLRRRIKNKEENGGHLDAVDDPSQMDEDIMMDDE